MRGARTAGPPHPEASPAGPTGPRTAVEVKRNVDIDGAVRVAGTRLRIGTHLAGQTITLRIDANLIHVIHDGAIVKTLPNHLPAEQRRSILAPGRLQPSCHQPPSGRSASRDESRPAGRSWSPANGCASATRTPERSSRSTSRTLTSASYTTAKNSPFTRASNNGPSPDGETKHRDHEREPSSS